MGVKFVSGEVYEPKDNDAVKCSVHGVETTWGKLKPEQRLAVAEGVDTDRSQPCLLLDEHNGT